MSEIKSFSHESPSVKTSGYNLNPEQWSKYQRDVVHKEYGPKVFSGTSFLSFEGSGHRDAASTAAILMNTIAQNIVREDGVTLQAVLRNGQTPAGEDYVTLAMLSNATHDPNVIDSVASTITRITSLMVNSLQGMQIPIQ